MLATEIVCLVQRSDKNRCDTIWGIQENIQEKKKHTHGDNHQAIEKELVKYTISYKLLITNDTKKLSMAYLKTTF